MPQFLKILEKFKAEVGTTPKGRADSAGESGVDFSQAQIWAQIMVCHHCGVKGYGVNKCTNITHTYCKQSWEYCNKAHLEKANTVSKEGTTNAAIAEVVVVIPAEDNSARVRYEF